MSPKLYKRFRRFTNFSRERFGSLNGKQILSVLITVSASLFIGAGFVFGAITFNQNIQVGPGSPDLTLNGNDVYVTGTFETDGISRFDATSTFNSDLVAKTGGAATFIVAANDASFRVKNQADYLADGTADDVQIQAAIDALPAAGGTVVLSEGTFTLAAQILLNAGDDDVKLIGQGTATILKPANDADIANGVIYINGVVSRILIADLTVDGNKANSAGGAHNFTLTGGASEIILRNVRSINADQRGIAIKAATDVLVEGCYVDAPETKGIDITSASVSHVRIQGCHIRSTPQGGIEIDDGASYVVIANNILEDVGTTTNQYGLSVHNHSGIPGASYITIDGNTISITGPAVGIEVRELSGSSLNEHIVISNNIISNTTTEKMGILIDGSRYITISSNEIDLFGQAIKTTNNASYISITGNISSNAGGSGIRIDASTFVSAVGNVLFDNGDGPSVLDWGILEENGSNNNVIVGNVVDGAISGQNISTVGAATIVRNNQGWITENSATSTIANASTTVTVNHGLDVTPTANDCSVTATNNLGNASTSSFWADTFGATTFTINVGTDPGASTATFAWSCTVY